MITLILELAALLLDLIVFKLWMLVHCSPSNPQRLLKHFALADGRTAVAAASTAQPAAAAETTAAAEPTAATADRLQPAADLS